MSVDSLQRAFAQLLCYRKSNRCIKGRDILAARVVGEQEERDWTRKESLSFGQRAVTLSTSYISCNLSRESS